jgi:hypothetical protein
MEIDGDLRITAEQLAGLQRKAAAARPAMKGPRAQILSRLKGTSGQFVMLPFPEILLTAAQLDATWLAVLIAVAFETWRQKSETVALPSGILERAGVNKRARGRALRRLVELEIVEVVRPSGKAPMVTLVWKRPVPRMAPDQYHG